MWYGVDVYLYYGNSFVINVICCVGCRGDVYGFRRVSIWKCGRIESFRTPCFYDGCVFSLYLLEFMDSSTSKVVCQVLLILNVVCSDFLMSTTHFFDSLLGFVVRGSCSNRASIYTPFMFVVCSRYNAKRRHWRRTKLKL